MEDVTNRDISQNSRFASFLQLSDNLRLSNGQSGLMNNRLRSVGCLLALAFSVSVAARGETNNIPNPLIDYGSFQDSVGKVGQLRSQHRVTEDQFIEMAAEPDTIVYDARSDDKYQRLHIKDARHLSFPEITASELAKILPSKSVRILIYCNNNFLNAPDTFATKAPAASLNIHTFNTLYNYGYTNVYELGPLIDIRATRLQFEGTQAGKTVPPTDGHR